MTGKEKQKEFLNLYLKPTLKSFGYKINGQTWWKDKGDFFDIINLQNFSWNSADKVDFCFNIGIALKATMKDSQSKPTIHDSNIFLRENGFLSENRKEHEFRNKSGYIITNQTDLSDFTLELRSDFEQEILPGLNTLKTIQDCVDQFGDMVFFGERFKKTVAELNLIK